MSKDQQGSQAAFENERKAHARQVARHFDALASTRSRSPQREYFRRESRRPISRLVPQHSSIAVIGCGTGELMELLWADATSSIGIDIAPALVAEATARYPAFRFECADAEDTHQLEALLHPNGYDAIVLPGILTQLYDVQAFLEGIRRFLRPGGRLIATTYSAMWVPALRLAERAGMKSPEPAANWLSRQDVENLLFISGYRVHSCGRAVAAPVRVGRWSDAVNRTIPRTPGLRHLSLLDWVEAEVDPTVSVDTSLTCTVLVPCRNEVGNIRGAIDRLPALGSHTEVIFVDGESTDGTVEEIESLVQTRQQPDLSIRLVHQVPPVDESGGAVLQEAPSRMLSLGKGDAVRKGFAQATGDILMILDSDLTVPPEDLPRFFDLVASGRVDFANGCRLIYPMQDGAMPYLNLLGNKAFSMIFSWLLGQPVKDTLCGTKALRREQYETIAANRSYFGDFDPFGDFDLLFGAAHQKMSIKDVPIRYRSRVAGESKVSARRHGPLLGKMTAVGLWKLKVKPLVSRRAR